MWWSIGGGIIIFALGMFIFLKPGLIWKLTEEWKSYRADEPSEFYLKTTKIGGILFALFGIIMIMLPVILENKFKFAELTKNTNSFVKSIFLRTVFFAYLRLSFSQ